LGDPAAGLTALAGAVASSVKQAEAGQADPLVSVAFALGWQMAELYQPDARRASAPTAGRLPGLGRLSLPEWVSIGLDQLQAGIAKLRQSITDAGLDVPDAEKLQAGLPSLNSDARQQAIMAFHVDLLSTLTAADYRLGKAYGLGRALADTTRAPEDYRKELATHRVATLCAWIRDLATAFPAHAGHAVATSLEAWSRWAAGPGATDLDRAMGAKLRAQGRLWRSLLSGEKQAKDMLEIPDYLHAADGMLARTGALVVSFGRHYWWLVVTVVVLLGGGLAAILISGDAKAIAAGVTSILVSLGITYKGVGTSIGKAIAGIEEPLWGAELDQAVYARITPQVVVDVERTFSVGTDEPSLVVSV
jgi:hypothetical protein